MRRPNRLSKSFLEWQKNHDEKENLCYFLFSKDHKRWREFLTAFNGDTHHAAPLLEAIMLRCSARSIIRSWDGLLDLIVKSVIRIGCRSKLATANVSQNIPPM